MVVMWKVMLVWSMVEDLQWKENDRKAKIGGHRRVSDEQTHQCSITPSVLKYHLLDTHIYLFLITLRSQELTLGTCGPIVFIKKKKISSMYCLEFL